MVLERERDVLRGLARKRWMNRGPGVLFGRVDGGLLVDEWVPLDDLADERPEVLRQFLSREAWRWMRQHDLSDRELSSASESNVPVVFCLPLRRCPHPELDFFWSSRQKNGPSYAEL